ncbi:hypothetical protein C8F04DRAFT_1176592 [Mycena alexandri]|uniref:Uncharacterized protein n=1 Tax=Mycena alexandri TaxID=1745969 RepID=A0AAD6TBD0_9AGAR|nr:hypothetical protein C8F04DRAFT_1176592 [Mycena alexandri]
MTTIPTAAPAPSTAATNAAPPAAPSSPRDLVNANLAALMAVIDSATMIAVSLQDVPLHRPLTLRVVGAVLGDLSHSLNAIASAANDLSDQVAVALPAPATPPATFIRLTGPWIAGSLFGIVPAGPLAAVPDNNDKWSAITRGKYVGLTKNNAIALNAVVGVPSALQDRFGTQAEALDHFNTALAAQAVVVIA